MSDKMTNLAQVCGTVVANYRTRDVGENNAKKCEFEVETTDNNGGTVNIRCVAWNALAEVADKFPKDSRVQLVGFVDHQFWKREGTENVYDRKIELELNNSSHSIAETDQEDSHKVRFTATVDNLFMPEPIKWESNGEAKTATKILFNGVVEKVFEKKSGETTTGKHTIPVEVIGLFADKMQEKGVGDGDTVEVIGIITNRVVPGETENDKARYFATVKAEHIKTPDQSGGAATDSGEGDAAA